MPRASIITSRPTRPSPKPTISLITSSAIIDPSTPASAPSTPASAQAGTLPGGGGSGNRQRDGIVIDDSQRADAGGGKIKQHWRAEAASANDQDARAAKRRLTRTADLAQNDVARVTLKLIITQHAANIERPSWFGDCDLKCRRSADRASAASFSRQYRDRLDLKQSARARQLRHADRGAGRRRRGVDVLVPDFAEL